MATTTFRQDLAMLLPDLFKDPDRILIDGPAQVDAAVDHYLDELKLSMSSNIDIVKSIETASNRFLDGTPKLSEQIELLATSAKTVHEKNVNTVSHLRRDLLELSFYEKALLVVKLANISRIEFEPNEDAVSAARRLTRAQSALAQLYEIVDPNDRQLKGLTASVESSAIAVVNRIILGRTLFEYVKFSKQTLSLDKKKSNLISALNQGLAVLNPPESELVYSKLKTIFWNECFSPILEGIFVDVRFTSSERLDVLKIRRRTASDANESGCEFAAFRLKMIEAVVRLMFESVFDSCESTMCHLGRLLWPDLSKAIVEQVLPPAVPANWSLLGEFRSTIEPEISSFVRSMRRYHFLPGCGRSPLDLFLDSLNSVFGEIVCTRFVAHARELVLDSNMSLWSPESKPRFSDLSEKSRNVCRQVTMEFIQNNPGVKVTTNAVECATVVHFLLEQANDSNAPADLPAQFLEAARAALFIFASVSPVFHEELFNSEPSIRALFAINCLLLSHQMARAVVIYNQPDCLQFGNMLARVARLTLQSQRQWLVSSADHVRLRDKQINAFDVLNVLYKSWRQ